MFAVGSAGTTASGKLVKRFVTQDLEGTLEPVTDRRRPDR